MGSDKELSQAGEKEEGTPLCEPLCVTYRDNHCCESAFDMEGGGKMDTGICEQFMALT